MTNIKNILQLGKFYPPQWGGIETVTHNLEEAFTTAGFNNDVLVFGNTSKENYKHNSFNIFRAKYCNFLGAPISLNYFRILKKIAPKYSHVIIHLPNPWAILCILLANIKGKVIIYWHSDVVNKGILGLLISPLEFWIINRASTIIVPTSAHIAFSKYSAQLSKKFRIIPFPVDLFLSEVAKGVTPREHPRPSLNKPLKIISTGRLVSYKGFEYLINSIPIISKTIPCTLDIVGDGPLKPELVNLVKSLSLQETVFIHGTLSNEDLHKMLSISDFFCLPSITNAEMYGMVQYEAMAYGLPIIATNIPKSGVPILIKNTGSGILVRPNQAEEIASGIIKMLSEPKLYNSLSNAGIHSIRHKFSAAQFISDLEGII